MSYTRFGLRTAYGQLILIVFLPIAFLASVGGVLVFYEITRMVKSEQDVLAQAALIRYEPVVRPLLPSLEKDHYEPLHSKIREMGVNGMTDVLSPSESTFDANKRYMSDQLYKLQSRQHVMRVGILDAKGDPILVVGHAKDSDWGAFDVTASGIWRQKTAIGTAYGMPIYATIDGTQKRFWLFVDMDDEPLTITYYRILLALVVTGLTTILLLLLILSFYSKRWIAPVYEMRLYLQRLTPNNLGRALQVKSDGEFYLLQKELNLALKKIGNSFNELKKHSQETEEDLQKAFDDIEMQNISIRKARDEALQGSAAKSAFLANISHELRTPINAIDGFINLLAQDKNLSNKNTLYIQTIKKSSAHLLALINDVLDFSKIDAGKLTLENQPFDLFDAVYEVVDMLSPSAHDKGLRLSVLYYQDVPKQINGDRLRVKQILTNLLGNAIKFTDTGSVGIQVMLEGDFVKIWVSDTGRGVDGATQKTLFTSFGQGDLSVTKRYGGTGLGLIISKELSEMMGGKIGFFDNNALDVDKVGATFWFALPYDGEPDLSEVSIPKQNILVWINHTASVKALKLALSASDVNLMEAYSLANLLQILSDDNDNAYDWVIVDSFGQKGNITALLEQVRLKYAGNLLVFGYEVGLDTAVLERHNAHALHEPLNQKQLMSHLNDEEKPYHKSTMYKGITVLAVDDHLPNLLVLEALLEEFGVSVIAKNSGFGAIEFISKAYENEDGTIKDSAGIDLVFMDIQMPSMSGLQASSAIRKIELTKNTKRTPIIALSAHGYWDEMESLYKAGIDDYATKPISKSDLSNLLQKWLPTTHHQELSAKTPKNAQHQQNTDNISTNPHTKTLIDWQDAINRAGGNDKLARQLFDLLKQGLPQDKLALMQAWEHQDIALVGQLVHKLVGACRYTGVPNLHHHSEYLHEQLLSINHQNSDEIATLQADFEALITAIDRLIKTN